MSSKQLKTSREPSRKDHLPYEVRHIDDYPWEKIRWPGQNGKFIFHPRPERPLEPNAGLLRFEPGAHHPEHYHGFSQVWYILSGEIYIEGKLVKPGSVVYHPDPHFEAELHTPTGGEMVVVQFPGPTTGETPIYENRFNMPERVPLEKERVDL